MAKLASYFQGNDLRKPSGGIKGKHKKIKPKCLCGGPPTETKVGSENRLKIERTFGGNNKLKLKTVAYANVYIPSQKKCVKARIIRVLENPANREYARRGIVTKGSVIETEVGKARVTSRPGQDGVVNAVLIE
ncbi:MAG: 30S ribosomal protein S8e [Thermoprotei archaeon]|nr:MAG: 30S ribosomal protein S8e [Thermoprotei archaeon]